MSRVPVSFEFFPPRDEQGRHKLIKNVATRLSELKPDYFSVTYGAGGSTRDGTLQTVSALIESGYAATPHLSMGADKSNAVSEMLDNFASSGVQRIVALRGDQPSGFSADRFANNAEALVKLIRQHSGDRFHLVVAAYPETHPDATSAEDDLEFFARKVDAGANSAITQYFYNVDAYADFMDRCAARGIDIPIVPGIMPITNVDTLIRFSAKAGADIPRWLKYALDARANDPQALVDYGVDFVSGMCERLINLGAPGLHFYTLNRWGATTRICNNLFNH